MQIYEFYERIFAFRAATTVRRFPRLISPKKLVFIHVPKSGGTSVLVALRRAMGKHRVAECYNRRGAEIEKRHWVISGHVRAADIEPPWAGPIWATTVRDPVDRLLSVYALWRLSKVPPHASRIRNKVAKGEMNILQFASMPGQRSLYSKVYFKDFPLSKLDVIIRLDQFENGLLRLSNAIGVPLAPRHENASAGFARNFDDMKSEVFNDTKTMNRLRHILARDIRFYESMISLPAAQSFAPQALLH